MVVISWCCDILTHALIWDGDVASRGPGYVWCDDAGSWEGDGWLCWCLSCRLGLNCRPQANMLTLKWSSEPTKLPYNALTTDSSNYCQPLAAVSHSLRSECRQQMSRHWKAAGVQLPKSTHLAVFPGTGGGRGRSPGGDVSQPPLPAHPPALYI